MVMGSLFENLFPFGQPILDHSLVAAIGRFVIGVACQFGRQVFLQDQAVAVVVGVLIPLAVPEIQELLRRAITAPFGA